MNYTQLSDAIVAYTENTSSDFAAQIPTFVRQAEIRIYNTVQFPSLRKNVTGYTTIDNKYLQCPSDFLAVYSMAAVDQTGAYEYLLNKDVNYIRQAYPNPNSDKGIPRYYALFGPRSDNEDELTFILGPTPDASYTIELHYYYYPESIVQGAINALGAITGGSGYTNGVYSNVALTGGSGSGATATIVVSGGSVTSVTLDSPGSFYVVNDSLSCASLGSGVNFSIPVSTISNANGRTCLGDNFDPVLLYGALVEAYTYMKGEQDMMALYNQKFTEALALAKRLGDGMERQDAYRSGQYRQRVT